MEKPTARPNELDELWRAALSEIELRISKPNFLTWFKNSRLLDNRDGQALVALPNSFTKEWVQSKYHKLVLGSIRSINNSTKNVEYVVEGSLSQRAMSKRRKRVSEPREIEKQLAFQEMQVDPKTNLNSRYTLDSFVVGPFNELAHSAALAVIENMGTKYNPLFIYGGVGLGKTHLIQAIGNKVVEAYSGGIRVKYVTSERFTNEFLWAIRNRRAEDVRDTYRNVDILIIDDIQFLGGKERTQEMFFHTFNALYQDGRQIILSSDRPPSAIATLEERLRSRFEGGMIADITVPGFEERLVIAQTKLQDRGVSLDPKIVELVAKQIQKNIREIEGILNKLVFHQITYKRPLDTATTEKIIAEVTNRAASRATPNQIIKAVAEFFEVPPNDIMGRSRSQEFVEPRQISMYLLRDVLGMSYPDIANRVGKRDHTTAIYACKKIAGNIDSNSDLNQKITLIKETINKQ